MTNREIMQRIVEDVASVFGVSVLDIYSARRMRPQAQARHVAIWLCRHCTPFTITMIGRHFGRDHTTILHAVRQTELRVSGDKTFAERVKELRAQHQWTESGSSTIAWPIP